MLDKSCGQSCLFPTWVRKLFQMFCYKPHTNCSFGVHGRCKNCHTPRILHRCVTNLERNAEPLSLNKVRQPYCIKRNRTTIWLYLLHLLFLLAKERSRKKSCPQPPGHIHSITFCGCRLRQMVNLSSVKNRSFDRQCFHWRSRLHNTQRFGKERKFCNTHKHRHIY